MKCDFSMAALEKLMRTITIKNQNFSSCNNCHVKKTYTDQHIKKSKIELNKIKELKININKQR
jgi:Ser-tRNA(Ala) deacylase AlaX